MRKPGSKKIWSVNSFPVSIPLPIKIEKLLVIAFRKYMSSRVTDLLTYQPTYLLTGIGARDAYTSKNVYLSDLGNYDENLDNSARSPLL